MIKVLKPTATNFKELEKLNVFLEKNKIELHQTVYNGIIYFINGKFYKYYQEGQYPTSLPPLIDGCYVECDANGNTDYYNRNVSKLSHNELWFCEDFRLRMRNLSDKPKTQQVQTKN